MAWEDVYPILKNYREVLGEEKVKQIEVQMDSIMEDLMKEHGLSHQDAVLVTKDILWKQWKKLKKKK